MKNYNLVSLALRGIIKHFVLGIALLIAVNGASQQSQFWFIGSQPLSDGSEDIQWLDQVNMGTYANGTSINAWQSTVPAAQYYNRPLPVSSQFTSGPLLRV